MHKHKDRHKTGNVDASRRTFLVMGITGIVAFVFGKFFGSASDLFSPSKHVVNETDFKNFKLTETGAEMKLSDNDGNDIFVIDKASFKQ